MAKIEVNLEQAYQEFLKKCKLDESQMDEIQRTERRRMYFGGMIDLFVLINSISEIEDDDEGALVLEEVHQQIAAFGNHKLKYLQMEIKEEIKEEQTAPKKDLKQIAMDLVDGKIFCDRMIREGDGGRMIGAIFLPLMLGAIKSEEDAKDIGMVYEYLSEAGPRSINGYPIFFSCKFLRADEMEKFNEYYEAYHKLKDTFQKIN